MVLAFGRGRGISSILTIQPVRKDIYHVRQVGQVDVQPRFPMPHLLRPALSVLVVGAIASAGQVQGDRTHPVAPAALVAASTSGDPVEAYVQSQNRAAEPGALVSELQGLLSHHATLAMRLARATLTDDPGFVDAAESSLVRNIDDLRMALSPAVGENDAERLSNQWQRQTQALFQYATAVRDAEPDARRTARERIERGIEAQSTSLAQGADGRIDQAAAAKALRTYFDHQVEQVEAFGDGDYARAYELQRTAFAETFPLAATVAQVAGPVPEPTPTNELQTALAMLLGEHVELAVDTMRTGATGADDFEAAAATLDANTRDVTDAMDALFGAKQARQFNQVWADHIDLFVDYTVAVVEDDTATKEAVRQEFDAVMRRFGSTLEAATDGRVDAEVVTDAMGQHEDQLVEQIEQYAAADYSAAHQVSYRAYQHIRHVSDVLATAFADAVADDMPRGGAQTGGGGTAIR